MARRSAGLNFEKNDSIYALYCMYNRNIVYIFIYIKYTSFGYLCTIHFLYVHHLQDISPTFKT